MCPSHAEVYFEFWNSYYQCVVKGLCLFWLLLIPFMSMRYFCAQSSNVHFYCSIVTQFIKILYFVYSFCCGWSLEHFLVCDCYRKCCYDYFVYIFWCACRLISIRSVYWSQTARLQGMHMFNFQQILLQFSRMVVTIYTPTSNV